MKKRKSFYIILSSTLIICSILTSCLTLPFSTHSLSTKNKQNKDLELFSWAKDELGTLYSQLTSFERKGQNTVIVSGKITTPESNFCKIWFELTHQKEGNSYNTALELQYTYYISNSTSDTGLNKKPSFLLLSHHGGSVLLNNYGFSSWIISDEVLSFIMQCPKNTDIRIDAYDEYGHRINAKSRKWNGSSYSYTTDNDYHHTISADSLKILIKSYLILNSIGDHIVDSNQLKGLTAYNLKTPDICIDYKRLGLGISGLDLVFRYKTYNENPLGHGLSSQPGYLLLSNTVLSDIFVLPVDDTGCVEASENLVRYFNKCPKNSSVIIEYYDKNGYKIKNTDYSGGLYLNKETNYNYIDKISVSQTQDLIELYHELNENNSYLIYADNTSDFYLTEQSQLYLGYETYSTNNLGYGLRDKPNYLLLKSRNTNKTIILNIQNDGTYKANTYLLKFICSCPDDDVIIIEYYSNNGNRITYHNRTYDGNGQGTNIDNRDWYTKINVTEAKKLIKQWQSIDTFDYLENWEIDKKATINWILGITD